MESSKEINLLHAARTMTLGKHEKPMPQRMISENVQLKYLQNFDMQEQLNTIHTSFCRTPSP